MTHSTDALTAAFKPLSRAFLSAKAKAQLRDRNGRFIKMNSLVRWLNDDRRTYSHGKVTGSPVAGQGVKVRRDDGVEVSLKPKQLEVVKALLPDGSGSSRGNAPTPNTDAGRKNVGINYSANTYLDSDGFRKTGKTQLSDKVGATYADPDDGDLFYIEAEASEDDAAKRVLAGKLNKLAGDKDGPDVLLTDMGNRPAVAFTKPNSTLDTQPGDVDMPTRTSDELDAVSDTDVNGLIDDLPFSDELKADLLDMVEVNRAGLYDAIGLETREPDLPEATPASDTPEAPRVAQRLRTPDESKQLLNDQLPDGVTSDDDDIQEQLLDGLDRSRSPFVTVNPAGGDPVRVQRADALAIVGESDTGSPIDAPDGEKARLPETPGDAAPDVSDATTEIGQVGTPDQSLSKADIQALFDAINGDPNAIRERVRVRDLERGDLIGAQKSDRNRQIEKIDSTAGGNGRRITFVDGKKQDFDEGTEISRWVAGPDATPDTTPGDAPDESEVPSTRRAGDLQVGDQVQLDTGVTAEVIGRYSNGRVTLREVSGGDRPGRTFDRRVGRDDELQLALGDAPEAPATPDAPETPQRDRSVDDRGSVFKDGREIGRVEEDGTISVERPRRGGPGTETRNERAYQAYDANGNKVGERTTDRDSAADSIPDEPAPAPEQTPDVVPTPPPTADMDANRRQQLEITSDDQFPGILETNRSARERALERAAREDLSPQQREDARGRAAYYEHDSALVQEEMDRRAAGNAEDAAPEQFSQDDDLSGLSDVELIQRRDAISRRIAELENEPLGERSQDMQDRLNQLERANRAARDESDRRRSAPAPTPEPERRAPRPLTPEEEAAKQERLDNIRRQQLEDLSDQAILKEFAEQNDRLQRARARLNDPNRTDVQHTEDQKALDYRQRQLGLLREEMDLRELNEADAPQLGTPSPPAPDAGTSTPPRGDLAPQVPGQKIYAEPVQHDGPDFAQPGQRVRSRKDGFSGEITKVNTADGYVLIDPGNGDKKLWRNWNTILSDGAAPPADVPAPTPTPDVPATPDVPSGDLPNAPDGQKIVNYPVNHTGPDYVQPGNSVVSRKDGFSGTIEKVNVADGYALINPGDGGKKLWRNWNTLDSSGAAPEQAPTPERVPDVAPEPVDAPDATPDVPDAVPDAPGVREDPATLNGTLIDGSEHVYRDEKGKYVVTKNGDVLREGMEVRSNKGDLTGTVVLLEKKAQYVKVRDADGKVRGRQMNTLVPAGVPVADGAPDAPDAAPDTPDVTPDTPAAPDAPDVPRERISDKLISLPDDEKPTADRAYENFVSRKVEDPDSASPDYDYWADVDNWTDADWNEYESLLDQQLDEYRRNKTDGPSGDDVAPDVPDDQSAAPGVNEQRVRDKIAALPLQEQLYSEFAIENFAESKRGAPNSRNDSFTYWLNDANWTEAEWNEFDGYLNSALTLFRERNAPPAPEPDPTPTPDPTPAPPAGAPDLPPLPPGLDLDENQLSAYNTAPRVGIEYAAGKPRPQSTIIAFGGDSNNKIVIGYQMQGRKKQFLASSPDILDADGNQTWIPITKNQARDYSSRETVVRISTDLGIPQRPQSKGFQTYPQTRMSGAEIEASGRAPAAWKRAERDDLSTRLLRGQDPVVAERMKIAVEDVYDLVPSLARRLDALSIHSGNIPGQPSIVDGDYTFGLRRMRMRAVTAEKITRMPSGNWRINASDRYDYGQMTYVHESGHMIDDQLFDGGFPGQMTSSRRRAFEEIFDALGIDEEVPLNADFKLTGKMKTAVSDNISKYASTNQYEILAELWAEYVGSDDPRPAALRYGNLVIKLAEDPSAQIPINDPSLSEPKPTFTTGAAV